MQQVTVVMFLLLLMFAGCGEVDEIFTEEKTESDLDLTKALNDAEKISRMRLIRARTTMPGFGMGHHWQGLRSQERAGSLLVKRHGRVRDPIRQNVVVPWLQVLVTDPVGGVRAGSVCFNSMRGYSRTLFA